MRIANAIKKGRGRIIISTPPRHGKSEFVSKWVPSWFLDTFPNKSIISCSYGDELASAFGRAVRNHLQDNPHTVAKLKPDSSAANRFETTTGGTMITAGIGGGITGRGGHLLLLDDPYKNWAEASSETYRKKIKDWFDTTFYTRQEPDATIIIIMTRWHHADLAAELIAESKDNWEVISLPAIAEDNDLLGRQKGDALSPGRYDVEALLSIKAGIPDQYWEALYQQRPGKIEGDIFKTQWWQYYEQAPPIFKRRIQFWDTAQVPGISSDFCVCATYGETDSGVYLLNIFREKLTAPELEDEARSQFNIWRPSEVVIENKSSGIGLIQALQKFTLMPIIPYVPKIEKTLRAINGTPFIRSGRVFLPRRAPWLSEFLKEHNQFPNAAHDDQVDTTSMMTEHFNNISTNEPRIRTL